jgi:hypothetical protein
MDTERLIIHPITILLFRILHAAHGSYFSYCFCVLLNDALYYLLSLSRANFTDYEKQAYRTENAVCFNRENKTP